MSLHQLKSIHRSLALHVHLSGLKMALQIVLKVQHLETKPSFFLLIFPKAGSVKFAMYYKDI